MSPSTLRRNLRFLYAFQFLRNVQLFGAVTVPFYQRWGRLDYTRMFILEASFAAFILLLDVPTGALADRYGRRWSLTLGALFSGASFVMFGLVRAYPLFFVANFVCAVGYAFTSGADQALLYESLLAAGQADRARHHLSRYQAMASLGILLGFPAGSWIAGSSLFSTPRALAFVFILSGIVFALSALPLWLIAEPARAQKVTDPLREGIEGVKLLLRPGDLRRVALHYVLISATTFFMLWFYQSLAGEESVPLRWNGVLGAGLNALALVLLWNATRLERRFGLRPLLYTAAFAPGVLYLALGVARPAWIALPAAFVIVGFKRLRQPLLADLTNQLIASRNRATVLSGVSMLERAVIFVLYPLIGLAADRSLGNAFAALGALTIAFALATRLPETPQPSAAPAMQLDPLRSDCPTGDGRRPASDLASATGTSQPRDE